MTTTNITDSNAQGRGREDGTFRISVGDENFNFAEIEIADRKVTGAQLAECVGAHPVEEFVILQHLKTGELESLRPTEVTDLGEKGVERFFVVKGSETYRFLVEGLSMEWPRSKILGRQIKFLARVESDVDLVLDLPDGDRVIGDDEAVLIKPPGVEELRIRKKPRKVKVIYNQDQDFYLDPRVYTTEELIKEFSVPEGYLLDIYEDGQLRELKPGEKIRVREGMEFSAHPPRGQSS